MIAVTFVKRNEFCGQFFARGVFHLKLQFSGNARDWQMWNAKFLAYAHQMKWKDNLVGKVKTPPADEDIDEKKDLKKANVREANDASYVAHMLCSEDICVFIAVEKPKMDELPNRYMPLAWANFINCFALMTLTSEIELQREVTASKLGDQSPNK